MGDSEEGHSGRYWPRDIPIGSTVSWWGQGGKLEYGVVSGISMPKGRIHIFGRKHALQYNRVIGVSRSKPHGSGASRLGCTCVSCFH